MKISNSAVFLLAFLANPSLAAVVDSSNNAAPSLDLDSFLTKTTTTTKKRFSVQQIANPDFRQPNVTQSLIQAYAKFGREFSSRLGEDGKTNPDFNLKFGALMQGGIGGTVDAFPSTYDMEYVCPVEIGSPPQTINLNLDTGSADLWVYSSDTNPFQVQGQKLYKPEDSTTSQRLPGEKWTIKYGDGSGASGIVYTDRVAIGDTYFDKQAVESAVQVSSSLSRDSFLSGILGLATIKINAVRPHQQQTYMDNIKDDLDQPLFTANLQRGKPGTYNFGYIDRTEYVGDIAYATVNTSSPFWMITVDGYQVGSDGEFSNDPWTAAVDTGSTLLLIPQAMVSAYYDQVSGSSFEPSIGVWIFPCSSSLPDFIFGIGSYRGVVPGDFLKAPNVNQTHCEGGIQSSEGLQFAIIGDYLLKAQFVVFHYGLQAVGFANKDVGEGRRALQSSRSRERGRGRGQKSRHDFE